MLSVTTPWYLAFSRRDPDTRNDDVYMYILQSTYMLTLSSLWYIKSLPFPFTSTQNVRQKKYLNTDWLNPHCLVLWHEMVKKQSRDILWRLDWRSEKQLPVRNKQQKARKIKTDNKTAINVGLFGILASWILQLESDPKMLSYDNSFFCFAVKNMNPSCRPPRGYIVKSTWRKYQTLSNIINLIINWKICSHFGSGTFVFHDYITPTGSLHQVQGGLPILYYLKNLPRFHSEYWYFCHLQSPFSCRWRSYATHLVEIKGTQSALGLCWPWR